MLIPLEDRTGHILLERCNRIFEKAYLNSFANSDQYRVDCTYFEALIVPRRKSILNKL